VQPFKSAFFIHVPYFCVLPSVSLPPSGSKQHFFPLHCSIDHSSPTFPPPPIPGSGHFTPDKSERSPPAIGDVWRVFCVTSFLLLCLRGNRCPCPEGIGEATLFVHKNGWHGPRMVCPRHPAWLPALNRQHFVPPGTPPLCLFQSTPIKLFRLSPKTRAVLCGPFELLGYFIPLCASGL